MKKALGLLLLIGGGLGYFGIRAVLAPYHVRYKITVDLDDNGITRSGSGVVDVSYEFPNRSIRFPDGPSYFKRMRGCAITISIGDRGLLFIINYPPLLWSGTGELYPRAGSLATLPLIAYGYPFEGETSKIENAVKSLSVRSGAEQVPASKLPAIVRFNNIADKNTIEEVDPADFDRYGLTGLRFIRAVVELTDEPVTAIPKSWPRWLTEDKFTMLDVKHASPGGSPYVDFLAFRGD